MKTFLAFVVGVLLTGASVLGYAAYNQSAPQPGAVAGPNHYDPEFFYQPVTMGGNVLATSSAGAVTYTQANLRNTSLIMHTATGALTATLPASSTLSDFIPRAGDRRVICINAITTKITLAGGTGTDLNTASSTKDIIADGLGCLDFVRKSNTDIEVLLTTGI